MARRPNSFDLFKFYFISFLVRKIFFSFFKTCLKSNFNNNFVIFVGKIKKDAEGKVSNVAVKPTLPANKPTVSSAANVATHKISVPPILVTAQAKVTPKAAAIPSVQRTSLPKVAATVSSAGVKPPTVVIPQSVVAAPPAAVAPPSRIIPTQLKVASSASATTTPPIVQNAQLENKTPAKDGNLRNSIEQTATTFNQNSATSKTSVLTRQNKSGIRIKYSGLNNSKTLNDNKTGSDGNDKEVSDDIKIVDETKVVNDNNVRATRKNNESLLKSNETAAASSAGASDAKQPKEVGKEVNGGTLDDIKFADIDDIELLDDAQLGVAADLNELNVDESKEEVASDIMMNENGASASKQKRIDLNVAKGKKRKKKTIIGNSRKVLVSRNVKIKAKNKQQKNCQQLYPCRYCGKVYRWRSTQRRHENVECGGKEPSQTCPYCPYKAKQRGNLGVHVRKYHPDKPKLESRRKRKEKANKANKANKQ